MVPGLETALGSLLSAFLQILFDRVLPRTNLFDFLRRHDLDEIFFENLKTRLLQVNAVLSDAEEKQVTNLFVRQWIDELKDAAYHTTDLLDEIHSLALAESLASNSSDESDLKKVIQKSKSELEKMTEKLENIAKYKDVLGLKESFSGKPSPRLQLTSLVDETEVYGRGTDKKEIMKFLTSTGKNETNRLRMMPPEFGMLKSLRTLTKFVVNQEGSSVKELGGLSHLGGKLSILELQNVGDAEDAEGADLKKKENIKELEFSWSSTDRADGETAILEKLHPHENIEKLSIRGNHKSLKLTSFSVSNCNNLRSMPEQMCTLLTSLQTLNISGCSELVVFPDGGLPPSLKKLTIQNCVKLQSMPEQTHKLLSSLRTLKISGCPELKSFPDGGFSPRLKTLTIQNCKNLIGIPNCLPLLKSLFIHDCGQLQFDDIMDYTQLQHLSIKSCYHLKKFTLNFSSKIKSLKIHDCGYLRFIEISSNLHQDLNFFQKLEIIECPILEIFPGRGLPAPNLTSFSVSSCNNLRSMPKQMCTLLTSLQTLNISDCPRLVSFPIGGLPPSLQILTIQNCVNLTPQNAWGLSNMTSLTRLTIECVYANVTSFPDEVLLPASLTSLEISGFPVLKTLNLSGLQHLTLLKDLEIHSCNQLQILSDGSLPSSLSSLSITGCSSLTDQCQRDRGIYWDKISHIPTLSINGNEIR
ncbi:hypothetical protein LWI29_028741 [Acer saccharum]|uniref:Rx N-terminal domain-containing protein n=1 Tax=Acer saccharum TaxID=4024 RepID=A0AA39VCF4_ACESA|nr:hypothetical protein LWI29_028741 [Acer saccharum]